MEGISIIRLKRLFRHKISNGHIKVPGEDINMPQVVFGPLFMILRIADKGPVHQQEVGEIVLRHVPFFSQAPDKLDNIFVDGFYFVTVFLVFIAFSTKNSRTYNR